MRNKLYGRLCFAQFLVTHFVYIVDEMGWCAGHRLHELSKMINKLVPGCFEPALVDWSA
jgi:hypothetical protein